MSFVKLRNINLPATMTNKISPVSNEMACFSYKKMKETKFLDLNLFPNFRYRYNEA